MKRIGTYGKLLFSREYSMMSDQWQKSGHTERGQASRKRTAPWLLGGLVLLLLSTLVALQAFGLWTVVPPDTASDTMLLYALSSLNFAAFIVFTFIFVRSLLKLRRERRERQLGSKIKTRLIVYFISVSLLPITAMAVFSYLFLNRSIEEEIREDGHRRDRQQTDGDEIDDEPRLDLRAQLPLAPLAPEF